MSDQQPKPPSLSDLIRSLSRRERLVVGDGATTADVSVALCQAREAWDQGAQQGRTRVVRSDQPTVSDLIRQLHAAAADDENGAA
jgi:hypothetical protein